MLLNKRAGSPGASSFFFTLVRFPAAQETTRSGRINGCGGCGDLHEMPNRIATFLLKSARHSCFRPLRAGFGLDLESGTICGYRKSPIVPAFPQIAVQSRRLFGKRAWPSLIVVRMTVAPIPIVLLHSVVLPVVLTITPVLCCQVTPVGVVFVVVPVMVITVVPIVDADLDAGFLSFGFGHN